MQIKSRARRSQLAGATALRWRYKIQKLLREVWAMHEECHGPLPEELKQEIRGDHSDIAGELWDVIDRGV